MFSAKLKFWEPDATALEATVQDTTALDATAHFSI